MIKEENTKRNHCSDNKNDDVSHEKREQTPNRKKQSGEQFRYDTPFNGGSAYDKAAIKAAKEGKWIADDKDVEEAKQEVKAELGEK